MVAQQQRRALEDAQRPERRNDRRESEDPDERGVEAAGGKPDADDRKGAADKSEGGRVRLQSERRRHDAHGHERGHGDVEAADEESARLSDRHEGERHRAEEEVAEVVLRQERVLMDCGIRAEADDQCRHEHERHPRTERLHADLATPEPTIASTIRRSPRSWPLISSMILPRDITTTRSQSPASSSGSLDLTMIAAPSVAFARSAS